MKAPTRAWLWLMGITACGPTAPEPTAVRGPSGALGICCPIDAGSCDGFRYGGWASALAACPRVYDAAPPVRMETDPYGCPVLRAEGSCLAPSDAGSDR